MNHRVIYLIAFQLLEQDYWMILVLINIFCNQQYGDRN